MIDDLNTDKQRYVRNHVVHVGIPIWQWPRLCKWIFIKAGFFNSKQKLSKIVHSSRPLRSFIWDKLAFNDCVLAYRHL